jgi:SAM-dependent methyltransferase
LIARALTALLRAAVRLSLRPLPRGAHLTRYSMYRRLEEVARERRGGAAGRILSVSRSSRLADLFADPRSERIEAAFPAVSLLSLPYRDGEFDLVVSDQVLEHVEGSPQRAVDESRRVLKPGGWAIHTTCLMNPIHPSPGDFWRFTPAGLRHLCRDFSRIVDCGGWGNRRAAWVERLGLLYEPVPHARWHPLHRAATRNEPDYPIVTWIVAEK